MGHGQPEGNVAWLVRSPQKRENVPLARRDLQP
jgi:hypothetical protein